MTPMFFALYKEKITAHKTQFINVLFLNNIYTRHRLKS